MSTLSFERKPMPVFAEHRPMFKIAQILLILYLSSRGKKSSLIKLHLFSWTLKDEERKSKLLLSAEKNKVLFDVWGVDPAVNISLQYALAEGLINRDGPSYKLAEKGTTFIKEAINRGSLAEDVSFLNQVKTKITETMVGSIVEGWE